MKLLKSISCLVLLPLFQFLSFSASGQTSRLDSLENLLSSQHQDTTQVAILNRLSKELRKTDPAKAIEYGERAIHLSVSLQYTTGEMLAKYNVGMAYDVKNDHVKEQEYLISAIELAERIEDLSMIARASLNLGSSYLTFNNNYTKSIESYLRSLAAYKKLGDKSGEAKALSGIGLVYWKEGKFEIALKTLNEALAVFEELKDEKQVTRMYMTLANTYEGMKQFEDALKFYLLAHQTAITTQDSFLLARTYCSIGEVYHKQNKTDKAIEYLESSVIIGQKINDKEILAYAHKILGAAYLVKNEKLKAEENLMEAVTLAKDLGMIEVLSETYHNLAHLHEDRGDYKNALAYHELHVIYYDSIFNSERSRQMAEMQSRFEAEKRQAEIEILKKDRLIDRIYLAGIIFISITISAIILLIVNRQKLKARKDLEISKKERMILEEKSALAEYNLQNKILKEEKLEKELEFKNKELTTFTLNLIQKNETLEALKTQIAEIRNSSDASTRSKLNGLASTVNVSFHLDKDWDNFKLHFQQVHRDFFEKLQKDFQNLSPNDVKVCALLKLNLGTKEMSSILDISAESVKAARYRIRKKIGLPSDQNLSSFFSSY